MTSLTFACEICGEKEIARYLPPNWREVYCNREGCLGLHALCPVHADRHQLDDVRDAPSLCVDGYEESDLNDGSCP